MGRGLNEACNGSSSGNAFEPSDIDWRVAWFGHTHR